MDKIAFKKEEINISTSRQSFDVSKGKPQAVSEKIWQKFQVLKERTEIITKKSFKKHINNQKNTVQLNDEGKNEILLKTKEEMTYSPTNTDQGKREKISAVSKSIPSSSISDYEDVQQYFGVNDHLHLDAGISYRPKSSLEKQIDDAITSGNIDRAEILSDRLATRNFAVKVVEAVSARNYVKRQRDDNELYKSRKKKKLHWGFEHKQPWETKSNM